MRHECEATSSDTMSNNYELDGRLRDDVAGISRMKLGGESGANPAGV